MVYCNRCGTKNRTKAKYCKRCGNRVDHPPFFWRIWQRREDDRQSRPFKPQSKEDPKSAGARTESPQVKRLKTMVRNLKGRLAESIPRTELESLRATLEASLAESLPKAEVETLQARLKEIESKLAESIPTLEAKAELESATSKLQREMEQLKEKLAASLPKAEVDAAKAELLDRITKLEAILGQSVPRHEAERLRTEVEELKKKLVVSGSEADSLRAENARLHDKLTESIPRAESEARVNELETKLWKNRKRPSAIAGSVMAVVGALCLILSAALTSTVLAFIGLGLAFWGGLLLFIRPQKYVRSELMDSTALSSLIAIDRMITGLGYNEKVVYIPTGDPDKAVVFIPSQTLRRIPTPEEIERQRFSKDPICKHPDGLTLVPPGLGLANLFERELGVEFGKCTLETLAKRLPRLLIEDLEMVRDFEMHVDGNNLQFKFVESIYSDFCSQLRASTNVCSSMGCPVCSAMACVLAQASGKPVSFDGDKFSQDGRTIEASYRMLEG